MFFSSAAEEDDKKNDFDLDSIPVTETLGNDYLIQKKSLAEAQQKKHKPTRASWAKSLDDENEVRDTVIPKCPRSHLPVKLPV